MEKDLIKAIADLGAIIKNAGVNRRGKMVGFKFQQPQTFNFTAMGNGRGLNHFSIRNTGNHNVIIEDTNEVIPPDEIFVIESTIAVMNDNFKVSFGENTTADPSNQQAIVRYIVDYDNLV